MTKNWQRERRTCRGLGFELLDDLAELRRQILDALARNHLLRGPVDCAGSHRFEPQGVSLIFVASSFRVVIHTWPEHHALTLDATAQDVRAVVSACLHALTPLAAELTQAGVTDPVFR